ncbi:histidine phosphatase family protein [soil metagenome]
MVSAMCPVPELWLARHGETEWSLARRHTSVTDLDLTAAGAEQAIALGERLSRADFGRVLSSPALRARRTAQKAGFEASMEVVDDLAEFRYGDYEGRTTDEICAERPGWDLWRDGCPGGETADQVAERADRVLRRVEGDERRILIFSHGHMSRVLAARWVGLAGELGGRLKLNTATLSILGLEHGRRAIELWNDACHLDR